MATISVSEIKITKPSIDTITFTAEWTPINDATFNSQMPNTYEAGNPTYGKYYYEITGYNVRADLNGTSILEGTEVGNVSSYTSSSLKYDLVTPQSNSIIQYPFKVFVSLNANIYKGIWDSGYKYPQPVYSGYESSGNPYTPPVSDGDVVGAKYKYVYNTTYGPPIYDTNANGVIINIRRYYATYLTVYTAVKSPEPVDYYNYQWEGSKSITFYPHQVNFSFNNCQLKADGTHQQWLIEKGINSLITNITDFQKYAWQWKSWKEQKEVSSPGSWVDTKSRIGAIQVNDLYDYVGITTPDTHKFSPGDKVTMALFNDLASKINS